ncbi:MAG TPA: Rieske (2Fe-2S) protein [Streptosporangiaceae bacterium]
MEPSEVQPTAPIPDPALRGSTRRGLLAGVGLVGIAGTIAACGSGSDSGSGSGGEGGDSGEGAGGTLTSTSDIPVGGGKVLEDKKLVVTQPAKGEFRCFSAVCTHRGCTVGSVSNGTIDCPCHGSKYSIKDASVVNGPATRPLSQKTIKVEGGSIVLG